MPTPTELQFDGRLSNISIQYQNPEYIADLVIPPTTVPKKTGKYKKYTKDERFTVPPTYVGPKAQPNEVEWSEVNGYLSRRYAVPVDLSAHADLAATLKGFTLDVAEHRLRRRRPPMPEDCDKAYANAKEWLEKVRRGEIPLPAALTPASTTADAPLQGYGNYRDSAGPESMN